MALSPCSTISLSMPTSNAVEIEKWQDVEGLVRRQLNSHVAPADALAWLLREDGAYPEGSPDALTQLAIERRERLDARRLAFFTAFGFAYLGGFQYWIQINMCGQRERAARARAAARRRARALSPRALLARARA